MTPATARKLGHLAAGAPAFAVRWLGPAGTVAAAAALLAVNVLVLPRLGGRRLWRPDEIRRGWPSGIVLYPVTVLVAALALWRRPEVTAAIWGLLAFGDGAAALAGRAGRRRLPWNPEKTWAGSLAHALTGSAAAGALVLWTAPGRYPLALVVVAGAAAGALAAIVESLPWRVDDNLTAPLLGGLLLVAALAARGPDPGFGGRLLAGAGGNAVAALVAWRGHLLAGRGCVAAWGVGTAVAAGLGWPGWLLLAIFFALGVGATRCGYGRKAARGLAQAHGGRRSARHVLANGGVAATCALLAGLSGREAVFVVAFAAALAEAAADTTASELGQLSSGPVRLITTLRRVAAGSDGGVSLAGSAAAAAAALAIAGAGAALGLLAGAQVAVVAAAGFAGAGLDSVLGATLERAEMVDNEAVNFLSTLGAALGAALTVPG